MELSVKRPWSITHSASFPSASSSGSSTPFLLSSLMNSRPLDSDAPLFLIPSPEASDFTRCVRITQKPLSPCRSPSPFTGSNRSSRTTSQIKLPPHKKHARLHSFRRQALCPGRRWHRIRDGAPRKLMYVICEEDEELDESTVRSAKRPRLQRSASDSLVPITSAVNTSESFRAVRFAHMVVEFQLPDNVWDLDEEEEEDDSSSGYSESESICSESTVSDSDLDLVIAKDVAVAPKPVKKPSSRLSRLIRGYY